MSSVAPESRAERLEEGKEGRGRSSAPTRLLEHSQLSLLPSSGTRPFKPKQSRRRSGRAAGPAKSSSPQRQPPAAGTAPRDPDACLRTHLSPPKPPEAKPAFRRTLLPVPAAAARCLTPSCPESPKSSLPARWLWLNHQHSELYMVGLSVDMVLMDAQLWWDTPLQASGKGYNLKAKLNEEGNQSQKTFPIFPPAGNTTIPQSLMFKAAFPARLQGQDSPGAVAGWPGGTAAFLLPPSITRQHCL